MAHSESDEYDLKHYTNQMKRNIIKLKAIIDLEHIIIVHGHQKI